MIYSIVEGVEMRSTKANKHAAVALLQLGPEVHGALESAARRSGHTKSEFVRLAVQGAIQAQDGYWERLLMDVFCTIPELVEAAADAGLLTREEAKSIIGPMDIARSRLYRVLDRIDGLPSIHWIPGKGETVRSYEEVMRTRASRDELVRPDIAPLERLENRFIELAAQRLRDGKKTKTALQERRRPGSKSFATVEPTPEGPKKER
jgi:hypothetical protein